MKKFILYFCLFFVPTLINSKSYEQAAQEDPQAFGWVQNFAQTPWKRWSINKAAELAPDQVRNCVKNMSCKNLELLVTTPTKEGGPVKELFNQYPFFNQLFEEQKARCSCCAETTVSNLVKQKSVDLPKIIIPAPIIAACCAVSYLQKQKEQDDSIIKLLVNKNNRHAQFQKNLKNFKICASPF